MYYLLIGYVQKWNALLELGNKNLHVLIVVKFTSEELIGSYTEKKAMTVFTEKFNTEKFNCYDVISYIRNIMN